MKKIGLIAISLFWKFAVFGQSEINCVADLVKQLNKTWTLKIDTSKTTQKSLIVKGQYIGFLIFTKGKQEISFCVYKPTYKNIDSSIRQVQKLASCSTIGETEKNQIVNRDGLVIFLSIYPCWTSYSDEAKKQIQKVFAKLGS